MRKLFAALLTIIALIAGNRPAGAIGFRTVQHEDRVFVWAFGTIKPGDSGRLARYITAESARLGRPVAEILFNSPGGNTAEGFAIGRLLRGARIDTAVVAGASCASACASAFLGGGNRRVAEGGRYGVHMFTAFDRSGRHAARLAEAMRDGGTADWTAMLWRIEREAAQAARNHAMYLAEMGVDPRLMGPTFDTKAAGMAWLTRTELTQFRVVTRP